MNTKIARPKDREFQVEEIRLRRTNRRTKAYEYMIKWTGWSNSFNTWEPRSHLEDLLEIVDEFDREWDASLKSRAIDEDEIKIQDIPVLGREKQVSSQPLRQLLRPRKRIIFRLKRKKRKCLESKQVNVVTEETLVTPPNKVITLQESDNQEEAVKVFLTGQVKITESNFENKRMNYKVMKSDGDFRWVAKEQLDRLRPDVLNMFYLESL